MTYGCRSRRAAASRSASRVACSDWSVSTGTGVLTGLSRTPRAPVNRCRCPSSRGSTKATARPAAQHSVKLAGSGGDPQLIESVSDSLRASRPQITQVEASASGCRRASKPRTVRRSAISAASAAERQRRRPGAPGLAAASRPASVGIQMARGAAKYSRITPASGSTSGGMWVRRRARRACRPSQSSTRGSSSEVNTTRCASRGSCAVIVSSASEPPSSSISAAPSTTSARISSSLIAELCRAARRLPGLPTAM